MKPRWPILAARCTLRRGGGEPVFSLSDTLQLGKKYLQSSEPLAMIYFVTKTCNATCAHCFYWESLNKARPKELTIPEIERIAQQLGRLLYLVSRRELRTETRRLRSFGVRGAAE
jgi:hypothetical protein